MHKAKNNDDKNLREENERNKSRKRRERRLIIWFQALCLVLGLPRWLNFKESTCNVGHTGDAGYIPGLGRPLGGNGNPLQYSCLEHSMDRGAWWATVHGVTKNQTRLSD